MGACMGRHRTSARQFACGPMLLSRMAHVCRLGVRLCRQAGCAGRAQGQVPSWLAACAGARAVVPKNAHYPLAKLHAGEARGEGGIRERLLVLQDGTV